MEITFVELTTENAAVFMAEMIYEYLFYLTVGSYTNLTEEPEEETRSD